MDDAEGFFDDAVEEVPGQRWHWSFLAMHTAALGANVANAVGRFMFDVATDIGAHANRQIEQDARADFRAEAAEEIDALLTQED